MSTIDLLKDANITVFLTSLESTAVLDDIVCLVDLFKVYRYMYVYINE